MNKKKYYQENEGLIYHCIQESPFHILPQDDAYQVAFMGMWDALDRVDEDQDRKSIAGYICNYIESYLYKYFHTFYSQTVTVSVKVGEAINRLKNMDNPTIEDVEDVYNNDLIDDENARVILMYATNDNTNFEGYERGVKPRNDIEHDELHDKLKEAMNKLLDRRTIDILCRYFGIDSHNDQTLKEIGKVHDITKERVRQIKRDAIARLRKHAERYELDLWLRT